MKRRAPWIVAIAFGAVAGAAVAADGDSMRSDTSVSEDTQSSSPPPGGGEHGMGNSSTPTTGSYEAQAADSSAASGDEAPGPSGNSSARTSEVPSFSQADRNQDGAIDSYEANRVSGLNFTAADTDTDGRLSSGEYETAVSAMGGKWNREDTSSRTRR